MSRIVPVEENDIPLSPESRIIRNLVRLPLIQRKPVAYQRSFLEEYEPGITFYLSESLRTQFHDMGATLAENQPAGTLSQSNFQSLAD